MKFILGGLEMWGGQEMCHRESHVEYPWKELSRQREKLA